MKTWLSALMLIIVIPSILALPARTRHVRRTCGRDLVDRVNRICERRGGHMTYTQVHRVKRGIVDECCMNVCLDHHLYAYCSNDKHESESSIEAIPAYLDESDSQALSPNDSPNSIPRDMEPVTQSTPEKVTAEPDHRYQNIEMNGNVDSDFVQQLIKTLPYSSNDFQVGTVPPEYRTIPKKYLVPSHVRLN